MKIKTLDGARKEKKRNDEIEREEQSGREKVKKKGMRESKRWLESSPGIKKNRHLGIDRGLAIGQINVFSFRFRFYLQDKKKHTPINAQKKEFHCLQPMFIFLDPQ